MFPQSTVAVTRPAQPGSLLGGGVRVRQEAHQLGADAPHGGHGLRAGAGAWPCGGGREEEERSHLWGDSWH